MYNVMSKPIVLIPTQNPSPNYLNALKLVGLDYQRNFSPSRLDDFSGLLLTGGGDFLSSCSVRTKYRKKTVKYRKKTGNGTWALIECTGLKLRIFLGLSA